MSEKQCECELNLSIRSSMKSTMETDLIVPFHSTCYLVFLIIRNSLESSWVTDQNGRVLSYPREAPILCRGITIETVCSSIRERR